MRFHVNPQSKEVWLHGYGGKLHVANLVERPVPIPPELDVAYDEDGNFKKFGCTVGDLERCVEEGPWEIPATTTHAYGSTNN